jgi:hypothetical protein
MRTKLPTFMTLPQIGLVGSEKQATHVDTKYCGAPLPELEHNNGAQLTFKFGQ